LFVTVVWLLFFKKRIANGDLLFLRCFVCAHAIKRYLVSTVGGEKILFDCQSLVLFVCLWSYGPNEHVKCPCEFTKNGDMLLRNVGMFGLTFLLRESQG